jgi:GT2 family glycosyltransferase
MVYFIVVTYNSIHLIKNCIESILINEPLSKIIIVDNNSGDGTVEFVKGYQSVVLFENKQNLGFGKANNIGMKFAMENGADYIYLLNHDAYLVEPVVESLKSIMQSVKGCGILTPFHLGQNFAKLETNFAKFLFEQNVFSSFWYDRCIGDKNNIYEVDFVPAASWFLNAETVRTVGYFAEEFFHYGEDNNYIHRCIFHGWNIYCVSNLRVVHIGNPQKRMINRNYRDYHALREKSKFLVVLMNINEPFELINLISIIKDDVKKLFYLFATWKFSTSFSLAVMVKWKIFTYHRFKGQRDKYKFRQDYAYNKLKFDI